MSKKQHTWLFIAQIAVSVSILTWLVWRIFKGSTDFEDLFQGWRTTSPFWIMLALLFTLIAYLFATYRWKKISNVLFVGLPFKKMFSHFISGQFVSNFLPGTIGGDALRVTRLSLSTKNSQNSFASVVIDRFCGWPVLAIISLLGFVIQPNLFRLGTQEALIAISIAVITLVTFLVLSYIATHQTIGRKLLEKEGIARYISAIHTGLIALRTDSKQLFKLVGVIFAMQFSFLLAAYSVALALNIHEINFFTLLAYLPPVLIIQLIPLSVGGFGVRETTLVIVLATVGVDEVQALTFGLMLGSMNIVVSLIGLPTLALGLRKIHVTTKST